MKLMRYVVGAKLLLLSLSLHAMQQNANELMVLTVDPRTKNPVCVERHVLNSILGRLYVVGTQEPYALVLLRRICGYDIGDHITVIKRRLHEYAVILKDNKLVTADNHIDEMTQTIVGEAIVVTKRFVDLAKPQRFGPLSARPDLVTAIPKPQLIPRDTDIGVVTDANGNITQHIEIFTFSEDIADSDGK